MNLHKAWLATGVALAMSAMPAMAADWGGIKDMGGGVPIPVPAPAPVPTYDADSDWYVGLALGGDISQDAKITSYDRDNLGNITPGIAVKDSSDIGTVPIFGLSFGRYITPSLRAEFALDYHPNSTIAGPAESDYIATRTAIGEPFTNTITSLSSPTFDTSTYDVVRTDTVKLSRTTGLVNLIYDIDTGTRFTPYIGGGLGFSWRKTTRTYNEKATCTQTENTSAGDPGGIVYPVGACLDTDDLPRTYSTSGTSTKERIDFAAAVQAGIATNITESIIWDNGWQMLWEGSGITSTAPTVDGTSTVKYQDAVLQQFRSGLRIKFD
jgi:opacity protein-like surface antigen